MNFREGEIRRGKCISTEVEYSPTFTIATWYFSHRPVLWDEFAKVKVWPNGCITLYELQIQKEKYIPTKVKYSTTLTFTSGYVSHEFAWVKVLSNKCVTLHKLLSLDIYRSEINFHRWKRCMSNSTWIVYQFYGELCII